MSRFPRNFWHWYAVDRPFEIMRTYGAHAKAFAEFFAFVFLLKTLFKPWKSISDRYPKNGFDIKGMLETWSLNATTRLIGAFVRLCAIIAGLLVEVVLFVAFVAYLLMWLLSPLLLLIGLPVLIAISIT